jgi:hypothetical protein
MKFTFLIAGTLCSALAMHASPIKCLGGPQPLTALIGLGSSGCTVDGLTFSNFSYDASPIGNPAATSGVNPTPDDLIVGIAGATAPHWPGTPDQWTGLQITHSSGQFSLATPNSAMHFAIGFEVTANNPGAGLIAASLHVPTATAAHGNEAKVEETVLSLAGEVLAQMQATQGSNGIKVRSFESQTTVRFTKEFLLTTGGNDASSASIGTVEEQFLATPEPATNILMGFGLLAFGVYGRRKAPGN